jgi:hypothetical protein
MTGSTYKKSMYDDLDRPCLGRGELFFSPDRRGRWDPMPAKVLCSRCPHRTECLERALDSAPPAHFGVWGGLDEDQRRLVIRCRKGECPPGCRHLHRERRAA